jgi:hypothetical protein
MITALLLVSAALAGQGQAPSASYSGIESQLKVAISRLEEAVVVDGALDEPAWGRAAVLTGFSQYAPVDGRPAAQATEVLVFYSPSAIFFGIRARAEPGSVRATLALRDQLGAEDSVSLFLSTYNDGRQAVVFTVNPLGVQSDGTLVEAGQTQSGGGFGGLSSGRQAPDLSPDFVFESKGRLTDDGYQVEVRIPFQSLRYQQAPVQSWGLHVVRKTQSSGYEDSWAPARRAAASFLAQAGVLEGIRDLRPGLVLDLTPVVTARLDGAPSDTGFGYHAPTPQLGGTVRWGLTPNLTLNGTAKPDFSQVEADAGQFVYDPREAQYFPEKRPFFLDGLEQFATPNRLIYTRRIMAPVAAAKLTGNLSGTNLGLLSAVDDQDSSRDGSHRPVFNLLRVQRDLGQQSKLGLVYTDKVDGSDYNRVAGLDTRLAFGSIYTLELQAAGSYTRVGDWTGGAPLFQAVLNRNGRRFGLRWELSGVHPDFRAEAGFVSRAGIARANMDYRLSFFGATGAALEVWNTDVVLAGLWRYQDLFGGRGIQNKQLHINNNLTLKGGWKAGASLLVETFGYDRDLYADYALAGDRPGERLPFVGVPQIANLDYVLNLNTPEYQRFAGSLSLLWGHDENFFEWAPADIVYLTLNAVWRPTEQLRVEAQHQLQQFRRRSDGSLVGRRQIPRLKIEYQVSRAVFLRVLAEYDAQYQDDLRDDSRSQRAILIRDPVSQEYLPALGETRNRLRVDCLFSWQPNPGTVFFAGYGSSLNEPDTLRFGRLSRQSDGFFVKLSYLFRL